MIEINRGTQDQADQLCQRLKESAQACYGVDSAYAYTSGYMQSLASHLIALLPEDEAQRQLNLLRDTISDLEQRVTA